MMLMFAGGAMSVAVMAALAAFIVVERLVPNALWGARIPGVLMLAVAAWLWFS